MGFYLCEGWIRRLSSDFRLPLWPLLNGGGGLETLVRWVHCTLRHTSSGLSLLYKAEPNPFCPHRHRPDHPRAPERGTPLLLHLAAARVPVVAPATDPTRRE